MEKKYHKNIQKEIDEIERFNKKSTCTIIHNKSFPIDHSQIILEKEKEQNFFEFEINFKEPYILNLLSFKELGLSETFSVLQDSKEYIIPAKSSYSISGKFPFETMNGKMSKIHSKSFPIKSKSFFRMFLDIGKDVLITDFSERGYSCMEIYYYGLVIIEIDNIIYHIYRHSCKDTNKVIIECFEKNNLYEFKNICNLILKSFGLITGNWYQNEFYIFSYDDSDFKLFNSIYFETLGKSIISNQELINPRQFRTFIEDDYEFTPKLSQFRFPEKNLSKLIWNLKQKPELERTIDLIIEGNDIKAPLLRCSIFHVALETIVGLIEKENKDFFAPIKRSDSLKNIKIEFKKNIEANKSDFSQLEYHSLLKKVDYINTPFNKDKFILAFKLYEIDLPENLIKLISTRNKFLHGKTPYKEGTVNTKVKELNLDADRIHLLVSILILKYSGYKGHIKNQAAYRLEMERITEQSDLLVDENAFYRI